MPVYLHVWKDSETILRIIECDDIAHAQDVARSIHTENIRNAELAWYIEKVGSWNFYHGIYQTAYSHYSIHVEPAIFPGNMEVMTRVPPESLPFDEVDLANDPFEDAQGYVDKMTALFIDKLNHLGKWGDKGGDGTPDPVDMPFGWLGYDD